MINYRQQYKRGDADFPLLHQRQGLCRCGRHRESIEGLMMRLGKGDGREIKAGGSFGVGVEQLRNGGCLSLPSSYRTSRGSKHEPSFLGRHLGPGGWRYNPPPSPPQNTRWSEPSVDRKPSWREQRVAAVENNISLILLLLPPIDFRQLIISLFTSRSQWQDITGYMEHMLLACANVSI